jgi:putative transposase
VPDSPTALCGCPLDRRRAGRDVGGLIHHSDKGVQDVAVRYTQRSLKPASWPPVGSTGDSYDNALADAFNSLFKANWSATPAHGRASTTSGSPSPTRRLVQPPTTARRERTDPPAELEDNFHRHNTAATTVAASVPSLH